MIFWFFLIFFFLGEHRHGAEPIESGERFNLIMWLRADENHEHSEHCDHHHEHENKWIFFIKKIKIILISVDFNLSNLIDNCFFSDLIRFFDLFCFVVGFLLLFAIIIRCFIIFVFDVIFRTTLWGLVCISVEFAGKVTRNGRLECTSVENKWEKL